MDALNSFLDAVNTVLWHDAVLYTVLGVGNRHGIYTQLAGCTIAVFGMLYAFYVKPVIKRRHLERAQARAGSAAKAAAREAVVAGGAA